MADDLAPHVAVVFGQRIRQSRKNRGWTQQDLAERAAALGEPLDRAVLSRVESGERGVQLSEALVLIAALDLAPDYALTPLGSDETMRLGSRPTAPTYTAGEVSAWMHGDQALPGTDPGRYLWGTGPRGSNPVASDLRGLVKHAETAASAAELVEVVEAGIARLQGALPGLRLDIQRQEGKR